MAWKRTGKCKREGNEIRNKRGDCTEKGENEKEETARRKERMKKRRLHGERRE
jgi:hypothetical protein